MGVLVSGGRALSEFSAWRSDAHLRAGIRRAAPCQVAALHSLMLALVASRLLQTSHRAAFHVQANELVRRQILTAVPYDTAGQRLVKRSVAFGADPPAEPATISQEVQTGQAYIPDLFTDTGTGGPSVSTSIPARYQLAPRGVGVCRP
jgi:hypothetical protein